MSLFYLLKLIEKLHCQEKKKENKKWRIQGEILFYAI